MRLGRTRVGDEADPAATLAAIDAVKRAGMRIFAGADDADVPAAGPITIYRPIELDLEADNIVHLRPPARCSVEISPGARAIAVTILASVAPSDR